MKPKVRVMRTGDGRYVTQFGELVEVPPGGLSELVARLADIRRARQRLIEEEDIVEGLIMLLLGKRRSVTCGRIRATVRSNTRTAFTPEPLCDLLDRETAMYERLTPDGAALVTDILRSIRSLDHAQLEASLREQGFDDALVEAILGAARARRALGQTTSWVDLSDVVRGED